MVSVTVCFELYRDNQKYILLKCIDEYGIFRYTALTPNVHGEVAEWFKATVLKTVVAEMSP